jgi:hypothetical protein
VARKKPQLQLAAVVLLIAVSLPTLVLGGVQLSKLRQGFDQNDLVYGVTRSTLQIWLRRVSVEAKGDQGKITSHIRSRLLQMTMAQRHEAILAMSEHKFWSDVEPDFIKRSALLDSAEQAANQVAAQAPTLGDVWFLCARMHVWQAGVDAQAERMLVLSQAYSPKESAIALRRLELVADQGKTVSEQIKQLARLDLSVVTTAHPERTEPLTRLLSEIGIIP